MPIYLIIIVPVRKPLWFFSVLVYGFGFVTGVAAERARTSRGSHTSEGDDDDDEDEDDKGMYSM